MLGVAGVKPLQFKIWASMNARLGRPPSSRQMAKTTSKNSASAEGAYRAFILDLYHATAISGHSWLHGAKAGRFVHVLRWTHL